MKAKINEVNENNVIIYFSEAIDVKLCSVIANCCVAINQFEKGQIIDLTPSYTSLLVTYNPRTIDVKQLITTLRTIVDIAQTNTKDNVGKLIEIPVYYSKQTGLDLEITANTLGLAIDELIQLHCNQTYHVFALGFLPGFAFMGMLSEKLVLPRLATPRENVPAGSVAIAENQTAVYPDVTPGGWRIIGRSPTKLFDPMKKPPLPYAIGDQVRFFPINKESFLKRGGNLS